MEFYDVNGNLLWKKLLPWCSKEYKFIPEKLLLLTALDGIFLLEIKDGKEIWYLKEDLDYWESFERGVPYEVKHALSLTPDNKVFAFAGSSGKEYIYFYTIEGKRLKKIYLGEAICKYAHHPMDCVGRIKKIHITNDGKVIIFQRGNGVLIYEFKIK
jgi:outer membrane protein assembly factor BamB